MSLHDWGPTDIDWKATRTCQRCGVVNEYNHGPNGPKPERFIVPIGNPSSEGTVRTIETVFDPGCSATARRQP